MTWVYALPTWLVFAGVVGLMCALAAFGLLVFRHFARQSEELTHNDVAGPIIGTIGTVMAVVLSFLLVSVWQEYDGAASTVQTESGAIADLDHLNSEFPQPTRDRLRAATTAYVDAVVSQEWPAMRNGGRSPAARRAAFDISRVVERFSPKNEDQQALKQDAVDLVRTFADARRERLFANDQGIPVVLWAGNLLLAILTIGFCYIFRVRNQTIHMVMTVALAAVIGTIFVLIALFDYPFRGDTQIPPTLFQSLQHQLHEPATELD